jgi:hypothetical protein
MGQYNLNRVFKPRHVAVVGASEKAGTICNALMRNLAAMHVTENEISGLAELKADASCNTEPVLEKQLKPFGFFVITSKCFHSCG